MKSKSITLSKAGNSSPTSLTQVGVSLLNYAKEAEFTARRGAVDDLFPFIYQASKRMSARAICRWLLDAHKVKLSAATIAKALREEERYWRELYESIRPAARMLTAHLDAPEYLGQKFDLRTVLLWSKADFDFFKPKDPQLEGDNKDAWMEQLWAFEAGIRLLGERWYVLDRETRERCLESAYRALTNELKPVETKKR
ncbi:MAG: hypothetical protein PCFJNLEI_02835 [Verrucomicrobiae bacterium]|nr:hypothetical protein [Verrucomicrobiae bacterium]